MELGSNCCAKTFAFFWKRFSVLAPLCETEKIPFSNPATHTFLTRGALSFTGGVAVDPNNVVYVADGTAFVEPGAARVVRLSR